MPATPKVKTTLTMKYLRRRQTYNMKENQRMTKWFLSLLAKKSLSITLTNVPTRVQKSKRADEESDTSEELQVMGSASNAQTEWSSSRDAKSCYVWVLSSKN